MSDRVSQSRREAWDHVLTKSGLTVFSQFNEAKILLNAINY
jgi:hypothetical protein